MHKPIAVVGYGALGAAITAQLIASGRSVRVLQRTRPARLPDGAAFLSCDVLDAAHTEEALRGAGDVICALGFPYVSAIWEAAWPQAMRSLLEACTASGARLVFADNLYMYGPREGPLVETLPPVAYGRKPRARAQVTNLWQAAHDAQRVRVAAVRAPDFYGPGVVQSVLGERTLGALARGKQAVLLESPDYPHDVAHVEDFARAAVSLLDAPDDAYGQAWHVPCAATQTLRAILEIAAETLKLPLRIQTPPRVVVRLAGAFSPALREVDEMRFLFNRPYRVDASKFAARFWSDPVPLQEGIAATARWFHKQAGP